MQKKKKLKKENMGVNGIIYKGVNCRFFSMPVTYIKSFQRKKSFCILGYLLFHQYFEVA